ncbi:MAG TPA: hypothetical protein DCZ08_03650 [Anaerolineaceae bacterium]|nr:hypothetical protein [Anaerolineaceae bacterium]
MDPKIQQAVLNGKERLAFRELKHKEFQRQQEKFRVEAVEQLKNAVLSAFPDYIRNYVSLDGFANNEDLIFFPQSINRIRATISVPDFAPIRVFLGYNPVIKKWVVGTFDGSYVVPSISSSALFMPAWNYNNGYGTTFLEIALSEAYDRGREFSKITDPQQRPEPQYEDIPS